MPRKPGLEAINTATQNVQNIIRTFDTDPDREGLARTPERYVAFLGEFLNPPQFELTTFDAEGYDEMIIQTGIQFYSMCEHHLAPFFGVGAIAYIPDQKIVGLSKLARTLEHFSRRFQNQERITAQVAEYLTKHLNPKGVGVFLKARHMCIEMRGVRKTGTETITSKLTGVFRHDPSCRSEFLQLANHKE